MINQCDGCGKNTGDIIMGMHPECRAGLVGKRPYKEVSKMEPILVKTFELKRMDFASLKRTGGSNKIKESKLRDKSIPGSLSGTPIQYQKLYDDYRARMAKRGVTV